MSTVFLKRIGYENEKAVVLARDTVAATADQVATELEKALEALKAKKIAIAKSAITSALSQLVNVVAASRTMSAPQ